MVENTPPGVGPPPLAQLRRGRFVARQRLHPLPPGREALNPEDLARIRRQRHVEADRRKVEISERAPLAGDEVIVATHFHQLLEDQLADLYALLPALLVLPANEIREQVIARHSDQRVVAIVSSCGGTSRGAYGMPF